MPVSQTSDSSLPASPARVPIAVVMGTRLWHLSAIALLFLASGVGLSAAAAPLTGASLSPVPLPERSSPAAGLVWSLPLGQTPAPDPIPILPPEEAPSVVWLVVMPAIPLVGGAVIYLTRRLRGTGNFENRTVTFAPHPAADCPPDPAALTAIEHEPEQDG